MKDSMWDLQQKDGAGLTSSSGEGGSGMGMSSGAWSEDMSVMLRTSSWNDRQDGSEAANTGSAGGCTQLLCRTDEQWTCWPWAERPAEISSVGWGWRTASLPAKHSNVIRAAEPKMCHFNLLRHNVTNLLVERLAEVLHLQKMTNRRNRL